MENKIYHIYHIPTFVHKNGRIGKIGCTEQEANKRTKKQGYTEYEILETHTDIMIASDREIELQKEYGYPIDKIPYYKSSKISTHEGRLKGGKSAVETGQLKSICSLGGKATAKTRDSEYYSKMAKIAGKIAVESGQWEMARKIAIEKTSKRVLVYKEDGTFVGEYCSVSECARQLGISRINVRDVCNGKRKEIKGYVIKFKPTSI